MPLQSYASHTQEIEAFGLGYPTGRGERDQAVLGSWRRCIDHHRLDPAQTCEAYIVPDSQLRIHREESESLSCSATCQGLGRAAPARGARG